MAFSRWVAGRGYELGEAAAFLGISAHTLGSWRERWRRKRRRVRLRGRPPLDVSHPLRHALLAIFALVAPVADIGFFRALFPEVPSNALVRLFKRCHWAWHRRRTHDVATLRWLKPGSVWAMDFTETPAPIDGRFRQVLLVTDLATGRILHLQPCASPCARLVQDTLTMLFATHGPPLIIKSDNGAAFTAASTESLLDEHRVVAFLSPPATPSYNGACEARIGSVKTRAFLQAARNGRPGAWTSDDLEAARGQINATQLYENTPSSPDDQWSVRSPVLADEREAFVEQYAGEEQMARARRGFDGLAILPHHDQASVDRVAIAQVLLDQGYLEIGRRRIAQPVSRRSVARIR